jgi:hypothetical protein
MSDAWKDTAGARRGRTSSGRILHGDATAEFFDDDGYPALEGLKAIVRERAGDPGQKDDAGKARTDLLPFGALEEVAHVMTFGATKYAPYNWHGLSVSRLFGASLRHLWAFWRGEDNDPETGRSHLAHAACCVLMVLDQMLDRPEFDDRP